MGKKRKKKRKARVRAREAMARNKRLLDSMSPSGTPTAETLKRNPR